MKKSPAVGTFRGRKGCIRFLLKIIAFVFAACFVIIVGDEYDQSEIPVRITRMDKHHFVLSFMQMDQCMPQPEQEWFESFGLHFRLPHGTMCPQPGLLICYRSQLDPRRTTNGVAVVKQYQMPNHRAPAQQEIAKKCRELNPVEGDIMHGIRVITNETNIILELSITDYNYDLPLVDHFWINFGRVYDLTTFIRLPNKETWIRMRRYYTHDNESQAEFMKNIGNGATLQKFVGLWMLGLDILPMEFVKELEWFVHRDCKCPIQAWFIHPTDVVELAQIPSVEFGPDNCTYMVMETSKHIGALEKESQITIWFSSTANTKFVEIALFAEEKKIFSLNITEKIITYDDEMNWDYGFFAAAFRNGISRKYLKKGVEIYVEINIYEFFIIVNYVERGEKMTNNFWPSPMETKFENCKIVFNTDAIIGRMEKKKIDHNSLPLHYSTRINVVFEDKSKIIIHGKLQENAKFIEINLMHDAPKWHEFVGATVLRIRIEFNEDEPSEFNLAMDTYNSDKKWHDRIFSNTSDSVLFNKSEPFKCEILAKRLNKMNEENGKQVLYIITLNGAKWPITFHGDLPIWTTNWLWFQGDMDLLVEPVVGYTTTNRNRTVVKRELHHLFDYDDALCISGFVKVDAAKFEINLFHEANEFDEQIGDTILLLQFYFDTNKNNTEMNLLKMYDYLHEEGRWSQPNSGTNPIGQTGVNFTIVIVAKNNLYEIFINGGTVPRHFIPTNYSKYENPPPPWAVNWITVSGDVENIEIGNDFGRKECAKYGGQKPLPPNIKQVDKNAPLKIGNVIIIQGTVKKGDGTHIEVNLLREALASHPIIGQTVIQIAFYEETVSFKTCYNQQTWEYECDDDSQKHRLAFKFEEGKQFLMKILVKNEGYEIQIKIDETSNKFTCSNQRLPFWAVEYISVIGDLKETSIQVA